MASIGTQSEGTGKLQTAIYLCKSCTQRMPVKIYTKIAPQSIPCAHCGGKTIRDDEDIETYPVDTQIGGNHYKQFAIQPIEFITKNKLNFIEGCIVKYVCRHKCKGGKEDLEKIKHYCDLLIELEYGQEDNHET